MKQQIVGCYIVKNEAAVLARSLKSICNQVDALVVVDTGSQDNTVETARSYGATVLHYDWQEDFAAARNYALEQLKGDWVVFLDADEYFTTETAGNLRRIIEQAGNFTVLLVERQDIDETGQELLHLYVPRIFRIQPGLRYIGRIHEELRQDGRAVESAGRVPPRDLRLLHTGYAGSLADEKAKRNLRLLLTELEENKEDAGRLYMYLAETYAGLGNKQQAMRYAYMDIARGRQPVTYASRSYRILLQYLAAEPTGWSERQRVAAQARQDFPELPEFHAEYAESLAYAGAYEAAIAEMELALQLAQEPAGVEPVDFGKENQRIAAERLSLWKAIERRARELTITACVIVRDGGRDLPAWIENARAYSDEQLVVDTGSADDSVSLARQAGCMVKSIVWQDDFAAARNEALKLAKGDWIVFLDVDERFFHPEAVRGYFARLDICHPEAEAVMVPTSNVDEDDGRREIQRILNTRLLKNRIGLQYYGRVHENLVKSRGEVRLVEAPLCLLIEHTGYSRGRIMAKAKRNLRLLEEDIRQKGEQPYHYGYLAKGYMSMGWYDKAEEYARKAIDAPVQGRQAASELYDIILDCMDCQRRPLDEKLDFAARASAAFPQLPDYSGRMGLWLYETGALEQAFGFLKQAIVLQNRFDGVSQASRFQGMAAQVWAAAGFSGWQTGAIGEEEAVELVEKAMADNPYDELVLNAFCDRLEDKSPQALWRALKPYYERTERDVVFLARWAERNGRIRLYEFFCRKIAEDFQRSMPRQELYQLFHEGKWQDLGEAVTSRLAYDFGILIQVLLALDEQEGIEIRQLERQCEDLLPAVVTDTWDAFKGRGMIRNFDSFRTLWPYIMKTGSDEQIVRYVTIAAESAWTDYHKCAQQLMEQEKWQPALALLGQVPQEQADGEFWQNLGICLYHAGEYEAVAECFERARAMNFDTPPMAACEAWAKEALHG